MALDNLILNPLELDRSKVWLCDLVPHSCVNPSQSKAIERAYLPIVSKYGLAKHTVPPVPDLLTDENRRKTILDEIIESEARVLILLGDKPIQWFLLTLIITGANSRILGVMINHMGSCTMHKQVARKSKFYHSPTHDKLQNLGNRLLLGTMFIKIGWRNR